MVGLVIDDVKEHLAPCHRPGVAIDKLERNERLVSFVGELISVLDISVIDFLLRSL